MRKELLFDKIIELKQKFQNLFQHKKKVTALDNFSVDPTFVHKNYLQLVKECIKDGFLEEKEASFLDHMLQKYEINYLDWSHRTKWLKSIISSKQREARALTPMQQFFNFERTSTPVHVPIELLAMQAKHPMAKRA